MLWLSLSFPLFIYCGVGTAQVWGFEDTLPQRSNSGLQAWPLVSLPAEPCHWLQSLTFFRLWFLEPYKVHTKVQRFVKCLCSQTIIICPLTGAIPGVVHLLEWCTGAHYYYLQLMVSIGTCSLITFHRTGCLANTYTNYPCMFLHSWLQFYVTLVLCFDMFVPWHIHCVWIFSMHPV